MAKNPELMNDLAIVILNYNSFDDTSREVESLLQNNFPEKSIYVVDNNSKDKAAIQKFGFENGINTILSNRNGGYAYGNNLAVKKALDDGKNYFLLLNPDIEISSTSIQKLYIHLKESASTGIIGPRICYRNDRNKIFSDGGLLFPEKGFMGGHFNSEEDKRNVKISQYNYKIDYVDGSALMFKKEVVEELGLMNESFFMYYEESEWCLRLLKNSDWKIAIDTHTEAYNIASNKGSFYEYYMTRNRIWLCRMYNGNIAYVTKERRKLAFRAFKKLHFSLAKAYIKGIFDGLYSKL